MRYVDPGVRMVDIYDDRSWTLAKKERLAATAPKLELLEVVPLAGRTADEMLSSFRCKKCRLVGHLDINSNCIACADDLDVTDDAAINMLNMVESSGISLSVNKDLIPRALPLGASDGPDSARQKTLDAQERIFDQ